MILSYDTCVGAFLSKIHEYDFIMFRGEHNCLSEFDSVDSDDVNPYIRDLVDGYMKRAITEFKKICKYDLVSSANDAERAFDVDIKENDMDEIVEIISEGMIIQWMKPYVYRQENLENVISTRDFSVYSPAELLFRISNAYTKAQQDYTQMIREYSYNHGDLRSLHI